MEAYIMPKDKDNDFPRDHCGERDRSPLDLDRIFTLIVFQFEKSFSDSRPSFFFILLTLFLSASLAWTVVNSYNHRNMQAAS